MGFRSRGADPCRGDSIRGVLAYNHVANDDRGASMRPNEVESCY